MKKQALVIGFGISGKASSALLLAKGFSVTAADRRAQELTDAKTRFVLDSEDLDLSPFSLIVVSPGIQPSHPLLQKAKTARLETLGEIELAFRYLPNKLVLGVTGSNGKTTTVLLTAHILNAAGKKAVALGNVGAALSGYALNPDPDEILVIELSSFQLESLSIAQRFDAAAILNITPNHLNRHLSMEEYATAKLRIGSCLKKGGRLFVSEQVAKDYIIEGAGIFDRSIAPEHGGKVCDGAPEWMNSAAARALCRFVGIEETQMPKLIAGFRKPPHRIEWVAEIDDVAYYNDSKASNVEAVIHAVRLFEGSIVLIAGGVDKGSSYAPWIACFKGKVKKIAVFGEAAAKMERELKDDFPIERFSTLSEALKTARESAKPGDTVLLSPGCSSYDQFANYEQRGDVFKKMVRGG